MSSESRRSEVRNRNHSLFNDGSTHSHYWEGRFGSRPASCNNSRGVFAFACFIIASSTRPAASASAWAWWWWNSWPMCAASVLSGGLAGPARCVRRRDTCKDNQTPDRPGRNGPRWRATRRCRIGALCAITMSARVSRSRNSGAMAGNSGAS